MLVEFTVELPIVTVEVVTETFAPTFTEVKVAEFAVVEPSVAGEAQVYPLKYVALFANRAEFELNTLPEKDVELMVTFTVELPTVIELVFM